MKPVDALAERWLSVAEVLEGVLDERGASLFRLHAAELREAIREAGEEVLTLAQAAKESGYSASRLRHLIAAGDLPQAGERGRPRIRRGDLPTKPKKVSETTTDVEREADDILRNIS